MSQQPQYRLLALNYAKISQNHSQNESSLTEIEEIQYSDYFILQKLQNWVNHREE